MVLGLGSLVRHDTTACRDCLRLLSCPQQADIRYMKVPKKPGGSQGLVGRGVASAVSCSAILWERETPRIAWSRVAKATDRILKHFETEETIILVSHGWFLSLLAIHLRWRGLIARGPLIPRTGYGGMTEYLFHNE